MSNKDRVRETGVYTQEAPGDTGEANYQQVSVNSQETDRHDTLIKTDCHLT